MSSRCSFTIFSQAFWIVRHSRRHSHMYSCFSIFNGAPRSLCVMSYMATHSPKSLMGSQICCMES